MADETNNLSEAQIEAPDETNNLSEAQIEARRNNSRKSTGPRTRRGKRHSGRNSRKHGLYSDAAFFWADAIELGEEPRKFNRLLEGLLEDRRPVGTLETVLVEEIALLIWKQTRLERQESAVQVHNFQKHDLERRKQFIKVGHDNSDATEGDVLEYGLLRSLDSPGKFEQVIYQLTRVMDFIEKGDFGYFLQQSLRTVYGADPTLRGTELDNFRYVLGKMKPEDERYEKERNKMTRWVLEEITDVGRQYELYLEEYVDSTRAARTAATAPSQGQWAAIIRQQNALHRQLERKIRLLLELQAARKTQEASGRDLLSRSAAFIDPSCGPDGGHPAPGGADPDAGSGRFPSLIRRGQGWSPDEDESRPTTPNPSSTEEGSPAPAPAEAIQNRGNEAKKSLKTKEVAEIMCAKRTHCCARNAPNEAKSAAFRRCQLGRKLGRATAGECRNRTVARPSRLCHGALGSAGFQPAPCWANVGWKPAIPRRPR